MCLARMWKFLRRHPDTVSEWLSILVLVLVVVLVLLVFTGCAAGRTSTGGVVVGVEVGEPLPEGAVQAIGAAGNLLGGVIGVPGLGGIAAGLVASIWGANRHAAAKAERRVKEAADAAYDEGAARAREGTQ